MLGHWNTDFYDWQMGEGDVKTLQHSLLHIATQEIQPIHLKWLLAIGPDTKSSVKHVKF